MKIKHLQAQRSTNLVEYFFFCLFSGSNVYPVSIISRDFPVDLKRFSNSFAIILQTKKMKKKKLKIVKIAEKKTIMILTFTFIGIFHSINFLLNIFFYYILCRYISFTKYIIFYSKKFQISFF